MNEPSTGIHIDLFGKIKGTSTRFIKRKALSVDVSCYVTYQAYIESKRQGVKLIRLRIIKLLNIEHRGLSAGKVG